MMFSGLDIACRNLDAFRAVANVRVAAGNDAHAGRRIGAAAFCRLRSVLVATDAA